MIKVTASKGRVITLPPPLKKDLKILSVDIACFIRLLKQQLIFKLQPNNLNRPNGAEYRAVWSESTLFAIMVSEVYHQTLWQKNLLDYGDENIYKHRSFLCQNYHINMYTSLVYWSYKVRFFPKTGRSSGSINRQLYLTMVV